MKPTLVLSALFTVLYFSSVSHAYIIPGQDQRGGDHGGQGGHGGGEQGGRGGCQGNERCGRGGGDQGGRGGGDQGGRGGGDQGGRGGGDQGGRGGFFPPPFNPPPYNPPAPYYPPPPYNPAPQIITEQIFIGRPVSDERISITILADLNRRYAGWTVVAVTGNTRPNSPTNTIVRLAVNETVVASQMNPGYQISLYPNTQVSLGYSNIELWINGSTYIDTIEIQLRR